MTTPDRIARDLRASLIARGVDAGTTWGDWKRAMQQLGVRDGDVLGSIEFGTAQTSSRRIVKDDGADGVEIREVR